MDYTRGYASIFFLFNAPVDAPVLLPEVLVEVPVEYWVHAGVAQAEEVHHRVDGGLVAADVRTDQLWRQLHQPGVHVQGEPAYDFPNI